jgi:cell division protein FtsW (lipid II flippase)
MITTSPPSLHIEQRNQFFKRRSELGLILLANLIVDSAFVLVNLSLHSKLPGNLPLFIFVALLISLAAHIANWILVPKADGVLLPVVLLLNGMGYVMIYRLDVFNKRPEAPNQLLWTIIGITVYIATMAVVKRSRDLDRYRYLLLLASIILLASPLVPGIGADINGARLWVIVAGFAFQPVEIAKLTLTIFFASYFVEKRELLTISTRRIGNRLVPDLRPFGPLALALILALFAIGTEHDVGFSLLLFVLFVSMIWLATGKVSYVIVGLILFALGTFIGSHLLVQVNARIFGWLHPFSNPFGTIPNKPSGYQLIQGMVSLARGGIGGRGWGLGLTGIYVPVPQRDYIFAAFGEELGLFGSTAI